MDDYLTKPLTQRRPRAKCWPAGLPDASAPDASTRRTATEAADDGPGDVRACLRRSTASRSIASSGSGSGNGRRPHGPARGPVPRRLGDPRRARSARRSPRHDADGGVPRRAHAERGERQPRRDSTSPACAPRSATTPKSATCRAASYGSSRDRGRARPGSCGARVEEHHAMKILVADDDPTSRLIVEMTLRSLGHECHTVERRRQAWDAFQWGRPDVVISDWMMPGLTGLELCRKIRGYTPGGYTYFIMVTSQGGIDEILAGHERRRRRLPRQAARRRRPPGAARRRGAGHGGPPPAGRPARRAGAAEPRARRDRPPRPAHRARQPARAPGGPRAPGSTGQPLRPPLLHGAARRRPLQGLQRHATATRPATTSCKAVAAELKSPGARRRRALPLRRRRVPLHLPRAVARPPATIAVERMRTGIERLATPHDRHRARRRSRSAPGSQCSIRRGTRPTDDVLKEADEALYRAKQLGRNRVEQADARRPA